MAATPTPFIPQTPPPGYSGNSNPSTYPGEHCLDDGNLVYCQMPDPNPARHFDTSNCRTDGAATYCSVGVKAMVITDQPVIGIPGPMVPYAVIGALVVLCLLAWMFGPRPRRGA